MPKMKRRRSYDLLHYLGVRGHTPLHISHQHQSKMIDPDLTAAYLDAWFNHEITDDELEAWFSLVDEEAEALGIPFSTYEETPIGDIQDT